MLVCEPLVRQEVGPAFTLLAPYFGFYWARAFPCFDMRLRGRYKRDITNDLSEQIAQYACMTRRGGKH